MKRIIALLMVAVLGISLCACGGSGKERSASASETATNNSISGDYRDTMTPSQIEDEVARAAARECLNRLEGKGFNLDDSKYKIGQISEIDDFEYEVSGTLYLYDKYGSVTEIATFTCSCIWIDRDGDGVSVGSVDINY